MPGLNAILSLMNAVKSVEENMENGTYIRNAVEDNKSTIVKYNVEQLNEYGVNSLGVSINTYAPYTLYTVSVKKEKGQPFDRVTLRDTGDFHSSFDVVINSWDFYITATDPKTTELVKKYGAAIFGLTGENKQELVLNYIRPDTIKQIRNELF